MKKLKSIIDSVKNWINKFNTWAKNQTEFYIAIFAALIWFGFYVASEILNAESYPVFMFQKIAFGILSMSIISGVTFLWLRKTQPFYFNLLDPDTQDGVNKLTEWEKVKVGLFWFFFYGFGTVILASLY
jgi:hypothetical protein